MNAKQIDRIVALATPNPCIKGTYMNRIDQEVDYVLDIKRRLQDAYRQFMKAFAFAMRTPNEQSYSALWDAIRTYDVWRRVLRGATMEFRRAFPTEMSRIGY